MRQQAPAVAARLCRDTDILESSGIGEDVGDLVGPGDALVRDPVGGEPGDVSAVEQDMPGRRTLDTGQAVEERALARSVGSDNCADLVAPGCEVDAIERGQSTKAD